MALTCWFNPRMWYPDAVVKAPDRLELAKRAASAAAFDERRACAGPVRHLLRYLPSF